MIIYIAIEFYARLEGFYTSVSHKAAQGNIV